MSKLCDWEAENISVYEYDGVDHALVHWMTCREIWVSMSTWQLIMYISLKSNKKSEKPIKMYLNLLTQCCHSTMWRGNFQCPSIIHWSTSSKVMVMVTVTEPNDIFRQQSEKWKDKPKPHRFPIALKSLFAHVESRKACISTCLHVLRAECVSALVGVYYNNQSWTCVMHYQHTTCLLRLASRAWHKHCQLSLASVISKFDGVYQELSMAFHVVVVMVWISSELSMHIFYSF